MPLRPCGPLYQSWDTRTQLNATEYEKAGAEKYLAVLFLLIWVTDLRQWKKPQCRALAIGDARFRTEPNRHFESTARRAKNILEICLRVRIRHLV